MSGVSVIYQITVTLQTYTSVNQVMKPGQENQETTWVKIEYHSNRFYIAVGANSTEVVRFRRSGT